MEGAPDLQVMDTLLLVTVTGVLYIPEIIYVSLLPAWISNHMPNKAWDEILYSFPNVNSCAVEVREWISESMPQLTMYVITYPCWYWS